jgi:hypothetical protein
VSAVVDYLTPIRVERKRREAARADVGVACEKLAGVGAKRAL